MMNNALLRLLVKFHTLTIREEGQDLVEYALVVGLVSLAAVVTLKGAANAINGLLTSISTTLDNA
jgi:pilus assembly protein Flp/PilA